MVKSRSPSITQRDCDALSKSNEILAEAVAQAGAATNVLGGDVGNAVHAPNSRDGADIISTVQRRRLAEPFAQFDTEYASTGAVQITEEAIGFVGERRIFIEQIVDRKTKPRPIKCCVVVDAI